MRNSGGLPQGSAKWKPVRFGGIGFCTNYGISADGVTHVTGVDVFNGYIKSSAVGDKIWRPAFTATSLPAADCPRNASYTAPAGGLVDFAGCFDLAVAPNSNSTLYAMWNARVYKSTDTGLHWTRQSGVPDIKMESNNGPQPHNNGPKIAIDPQNASVVLIGTQNNGLYYTTNGGTTWTNVALGVNGTTRTWQVPSKVACDPTGSVVSTVKQRWIAWLQGTGGRISTTGPGGTYSAMTGGPAYIGDLCYDSSGNAWCTDYNNNGTSTSALYKCAAGGTTWVQVSTPNLQGYNAAIACDPLNVGRMVVIGDDGLCIVSSDGGATWLGSGVYNPPALGVFPYSLPWISGGMGHPVGAGRAVFDPVVSNLLHMSSGVGVFQAFVPTAYDGSVANGQFRWQETTEGIECSDATNMVEGLGQSPLFGIWDQGIWRFDDLDHSWRGFATRAPAGAFNTSVTAGWDVDVAKDDPTWVAALLNFSGQWSAYSTDSWNTCQVFPTAPPYDFVGGCLCVGPKNNVLINQVGGDAGNWAPPYQTKDGGSTWRTINVPNATASFTGKIDNGSGSSGNTLTVTAMNFGTIITGMAITTGAGGNGSMGNVTGQLTGTTGGVGTYSLSASHLVTSTTLSATTGGFGANADYVGRKNVAYDAIAGKYYITNYGPNNGPVDFSSVAGIYSTTDLASAWAKIFTGRIWSVNDDFWGVRLKWVPGQQGHFFVCSQNQAVALKRSTDGCVTWQTVPNVTSVNDIVFGAAAPGQTYPSIYFLGSLSGVFGIYRSDDNFATTPKLLTQYPNGCVDNLGYLGASPNKYGRVYCGTGGSGWLYADYDDTFTVS